MKTREDCIFCKIVAGQIPCVKIYEDDKTLSFMDVSPLNKGHLLVIPKEHFETIAEVDPDLYGRLYTVTAKVSAAVNAGLKPDGINIMQLNGRAANQVVPHVHVHLVPRWSGDQLTICAWEPVPGNREEIAATAETIKSSL